MKMCLRLNIFDLTAFVLTGNTNCSEDVTRICKNISYMLTTYYLSVLLPQLCQKNGYDFNTCKNLRHILHTTDVITSFVELIVDGPVGKLV